MPDMAMAAPRINRARRAGPARLAAFGRALWGLCRKADNALSRLDAHVVYIALAALAIIGTFLAVVEGEDRAAARRLATPIAGMDAMTAGK